MASTRRILAGVVAAWWLLGACGDDGPDDPTPDVAQDVVDAVSDADDADDAVEEDADTAGDDTVSPHPPAGPCDPLDQSHCLLPFPSSLYLRPDEARVTGYTLDFGAALPRNAVDKPVESEPYQRHDGYGVSTPLIVHFRDLDATGMAHEYDTDPSLEPDAPIVWLEVHEGEVERVPYFVDFDGRALDPSRLLTFVRPARILKPNRRYVVAFRGLVDTSGQPIPRSAAFTALVQGETGTSVALGPRQARFDEVFAILEGEGIARQELTLAWDFVTASQEALHGAMVHMREDGLAAVGADGPELVDVEVEELEHDNWALEIRGKFLVPHYMRATPAGWRFNLGADGLPEQDGFREAPFWIRVPRSALPEGEASEGRPHSLVLYGHGQNGSGTQVRAGHNGRVANTHDFIYYATDMWGMSEEDVAGILSMLPDLSDFPRLADRLHQGILNHVLLARAMQRQLATLPELTSRGVVVNTEEHYYKGISQGGIYGATVVALSPDIRRGHLGVPGNNYSYLLGRSRNFEPFLVGLQTGYADRWEVLILLQVIHQLWEGADPVSWLRHVHAEPILGDPPNDVLLAPVRGDVQVAVTTNEWIARSGIGIPILEPYDLERGVPTGAESVPYPREGSGIVLYAYEDNPWPEPSLILPPTSTAPDPHGRPRNEAHHNLQMERFFRTGVIIDVCSDDGEPGCTPE